MKIQPAQRLKNIGEYYFSKKLEIVRQMNASGLSVINLGIGSPDLTPSETSIAATVQSLQSPHVHGYAAYRSSPELRRAMADWYAETFRVRLDPNKNVLPLLGSKEGILYLSMAILNPGDGVLIPNPGYPAYSSVAHLVGAKIHTYDLKDQKGWLPDFDALEKADLTGCKMMWVNYPHMPTGRAAPPEIFKRLVEFAHKKEILICHDNPYSQVLHSDPPRSMLEADPQMEVSLELNSLSKSFNMAGWRIGMLMAHEQIIQATVAVKSNADSGMFYPIQAGAIAALKNSAQWHEERNQVYRARRAWVWKIFDELGFEYSKDQVGLFVWARVPDSIPQVEFFLDQLLDQAHVFITPGMIFGSNGERYARSSLCASESVLQEAHRRVAHWMATQRGRR